LGNGEELIFCTDHGSGDEQGARYGWFMHEAEVLIYPLARAVEAGEMTAEGARETFEPYRNLMPELYDLDEMEEYEYGFLTIDHLMDWGVGPGISEFWNAAEEAGIPGVIYSEGDSPGGTPWIEVRDKKALEALRAAMAGRYKIVVRDQNMYDTSTSSDYKETLRIIEVARNEQIAD
jgi:hypothetical protein